MIGDSVKKPNGGDDFLVSLFEDLDRGIRRRDQEMKRWEYNEKFDDLNQWGGEGLRKGMGDECTINKVASYIRNYRAEVAYNDPRVKLTPKTSAGWEPILVPVVGPDGTPKMGSDNRPIVKRVVPAKAREALINGILSSPEQNLQMTSGLFTKAGIIAIGYLKVVYNPIYETEPEKEDKQVIPLTEDGKLDLSGFEKNRVTGALVRDGNRFVERRDIPVWEDFTIRWVPYKNMIIDPDGGTYWSDHSWVAEEEIKTVKQVKDDPLYENTKDLKASGRRESDIPRDNSSPEGGTWSDARGGEDSDNDKLVRLFHIYDMDRQRYYLLADGHDKMLRDVSWVELGIVDHPYVDFRPSLGTDGEFYQRPIVSDLVPIAQTRNTLSQMVTRAGESSTRKVFLKKSKFDTFDLEKFQSNEDLEVIAIDCKNNERLSDVILPYTPPNPTPILLQAIQMLDADFNEIGGMSGQWRGKADADTATESSIINTHDMSRAGHDRKILSESWRRAFKKKNDNLDRWMTKPRAVQLQGEDGEAFTALIDPNMIAGDYDVDVDFQEMAPPNTAMQNAGKIQIMQLVAQNRWLAKKPEVMRELAEPYGIKSENFFRGITEAVLEEERREMEMLQMQLQLKQQAQQKKPASSPPTSEAQAISQSAAGQQVPRMSGRP